MIKTVFSPIEENMKRKPIIILFTVLLITLCALSFSACQPVKDEPYAEINAKLRNFATSVKESDRYSYEAQLTLGDYVGKQLVKTTQSPFYWESSMFYNAPYRLEKLIREENGKLYSYANERDNYYKRKLWENNDDGENAFDVSLLLDLTLTNGADDMAYKNGEYVVTADYKDIEYKYFKDMTDLSLEEKESEALHSSVLTLKIKASETKAVISLATELNSVADGKKFEFAVTVDLSEFKQIDFDNGEYRVLNATSIDEVYKLTDITKPIECDANYNVFKVELDKGLYCLEYDSIPHVKICSAEDLNDRINPGIIDEYIYNSDETYDYCFKVEKSGQYYVSFEYCENQTYEIVRLNYDDWYDANKPKVLRESTAGTIEGKYDLEYYSYSNENEGLLTITNTSNTAIEIICKGSSINYNYGFFNLDAGQSLKNILIKGAEFTFWVGKPDAEQAVNYSLSASFYCNNNGLSGEFDEMPWITNEFGEEYYAVGCGLSPKYVRMHIDTKGLYDFAFENLYDDLSDNLSVEVYDSENNSVNYKYDALESGDYTVCLTNSLFSLSIAKIKLVLVKTAEDFETKITLNTVSFDEITTEKARVEQLKTADNQVVKYNFTSDNDCMVMYSNYICIFDAEDNPLTFGASDIGAIKLKAGDYYYIPYPMFNQAVQIAIVDDYEGSVIDYGNMPTLTLTSDIVFEGNPLRTGYAVLEIESDGLYYFEPNDRSLMQVYVYGEGLNQVATVNRYDYFYELKAGTYYINVEFYTNNGIPVTLKQPQE